MGSLWPARLVVLALLGGLVLSPTGCGSSSAGTATVEAATRAYVEGINARDGEAVCALMLDSVKHEFQLPTGGCADFVSGFIGYQEDSGSDVFVRATILELHEAGGAGELLRAKLKVQIELEDGGSEVLDDVLWLVDRGGSLRLAKASALLYASFGANVPEDVLEPPELAAQDQAYEEELAAEREAAEAEAASYQPLEGDVFDCRGATTSEDDPALDLHFEGDRPLEEAEAEAYLAADLRRVDVSSEGDDLCVRFILAGADVEERLVLSFRINSPDDDPAARQLPVLFDVVSGDRGRLVYESPDNEDEWGRGKLLPIRVRVGRDGNAFSFRVARADLMAVVGDRFEGVPEWDEFLWLGQAFYLTRVNGRPRAVSDDLETRVAHAAGTSS
jgi:ketosteroid isomerase-like protein